MINDLKLQDKSFNAAKNFLKERYGLTSDNKIVEDKKNDILVYEDKEENIIRFIELRWYKPASTPDKSLEDNKNYRKKCEKYMVKFLSENDYVDMFLRWDTLDLMIINDDRALIRCHINALKSTNK